MWRVWWRRLLAFVTGDMEYVYSLIYLDPPGTDNPRVQCPQCGLVAPRDYGFSYLKGEMNGIEPGSQDDVDQYECGDCLARLSYDEAMFTLPEMEAI